MIDIYCCFVDLTVSVANPKRKICSTKPILPVVCSPFAGKGKLAKKHGLVVGFFGASVSMRLELLNLTLAHGSGLLAQRVSSFLDGVPCLVTHRLGSNLERGKSTASCSSTKKKHQDMCVCVCECNGMHIRTMGLTYTCLKKDAACLCIMSYSYKRSCANVASRSLINMLQRFEPCGSSRELNLSSEQLVGA